MKLTTVLTLCTIGLALPAAAATPQQFDLVCHSTTRTTAPDIKLIERTDDARFSVDLGHKVWCRLKDGACPRVQPIAAATGDVLTLSNASNPGGDNRTEVDLKSGAYSALVRVKPGVMPEINSTAKGTCKVAPFTPGVL